ncbi:MAG: TatD family hydrolase [Acidiferrobacterales bacterium]|nr:TatD family hydrolase [Acidiferrobacterales bacterium]
MLLADSHCHIDFPQFDDKFDSILTEARNMDVGYLLCVSVNIEDFPRILAMSYKYDEIYASMGVHPNTVDAEDPDVTRLTELGSDPNVVAIGETGLDYFRSSGELDWQRDRFARHIEAGKILDKPIIVHSRDAPDDTIRIMKECDAGEAGGVMHCFTGDYEMAKSAMDLGFYISFSGIVTFKNAADLADVARKIPIERMLIETDSPYLAPVPKRGKENQPAFVRHTAEFLSNLKGMQIEEFAEKTTANFLQLFKIH